MANVQLFVFYLSLGLVRVREIDIFHMGKNNGHPDLVCEKTICTSLLIYYGKSIPMFRIIQPYLNLLVKPRFFLVFWKNIILCILKGVMLFKMHKIIFFQKKICVPTNLKFSDSLPETHFLDLHLSISNDIVSTKIYDKRDDFDFEIVNFPFLDGDVPRSTSYGVYISQLIRFARASSYFADFNTRNKLLTQKLLKQGYWYHKLRKIFSKFYRRYYDLIFKFQVGLKSLLRQGLSEPDF